ncbi:unnamed protein product, partial [Ectocarpus sp. 12 AP-2014]
IQDSHPCPIQQKLLPTYRCRVGAGVQRPFNFFTLALLDVVSHGGGAVLLEISYWGVSYFVVLVELLALTTPTQTYRFSVGTLGRSIFTRTQLGELFRESYKE